MKQFALCLVATAALTSSALAADVSTPSAYDWSGIYVGAQIGGAWADLDVDATPYGGPQWENEPSAIYFGGLLGANYQIDQIVVGIEGDIGLMNGSTDEVDIGLNGWLGQGDLDYLGTVRGRLGLAFDRVLVYGTAGVGWLGTEMTLNNGATNTDTKLDHFGWVAGAGAEWAVTDNVSVRAEYLYGDFDTETSVNSLGPIGDVDPTLNVVRAAVVFKF